MSEGLIGYTGFVGGNLHRQHAFNHLYNSSNIQEIARQEFDLLVCAGVSAVKYKANQDPAGDWAGIQKLLTPLLTVKAKELVLISTIDVYPNPVGVNEQTDLSQLDNHAYGKNRLKLEGLVRQQFPNVHVVRLPGLYGPGLKKNIIFDILNHNPALNMIHSESVFQFYNLANLWNDLQVVVEKNIPLLNITAEPVKAKDIAQRCFGIDFQNLTDKPALKYDVQTIHAQTFGKTGPYLYSAEYTFEQIKKFIATEPKSPLV